MSALRIGFAADFLGADGAIALDREQLARLLALPGVECVPLAGRGAGHAIEALDLAAFDMLVSKRNPLRAPVLQAAPPRCRLVARMGVGFDHIDMAAATDAGVLVVITPDAVRRPVASGILALILALAHRLPERDRAARAGAWHERFARPGTGLEGRTLGVVGLGNIGTELVKLIRPFGMRHLFADPRATPAHAAALDGRLVPLDELIAAADFLVLACPLTEATRGMVDRAWLRRMKASAYLVNMARGELVVQPALVEALSEGWIAGAGIDVFEVEPPDPSDPLLGLSNVILSSHNLCFTDELDRLGHQGVVDAITACVDGRLPDHALNPEAWRRSDAS